MRFFKVAIAIFAFNLVRNPRIWKHPFFWAEDGQAFFAQSIEKGLSSIWSPLVGHFHTIPRIISFLCSYLPSVLAPLLYSLSAGLVAATCLAVFSKNEYRWLVKSDGLRIFSCFAFAIACGVLDSFFTLACLNYFIFIGIFFLLLGRDESGSWKMPWKTAFLISFLWFSAGQSILLVPPLLYLLFTTRKGQYFFLTATLGISVLTNFLSVRAQPTSQVMARSFPEILLDASRAYVDNLFLRFVFSPIFGSGRLDWILKDNDILYYVLVGTLSLLFGLVLYLKRAWLKDKGVQMFLICTFSLMSIFSLTALVRPSQYFTRPDFIFGQRYAIVPGVLWIILFFVGYSCLLKRLHGKSVLKVLVTLLLIPPFWNFNNERVYKKIEMRPGVMANWPEEAARIDLALKLRRQGLLKEAVSISKVDIEPMGWSISGLKIYPAR